MKKSFLIFLSALLLTFTACFTSCDSWMSDDDFYGEIENDVKVANAAAVSVYVRYANSKMGSTEPSGFTTLKVDVPSTLTAVTNDDYGFVRWVAFSTSDFPTNQQHSNLFYENEDHYAENYLPLELPASEVFFSDPTKTSTKVTLYTTRSDIFIMPLVTKRPTVVTSVPSNGRSDVVRNTSIRILFSKKIDPASLKDEFGNSNIVVTSGSAVLTETSGDLSAKDVTNNCTITLGKSGKMLTISPNSGFYFDNNSQITVNIYEDVCDVDGYGMNGKYSFSFTTGVKLDSLAPYIKELWASPDADFSEEHKFYQYKYIGQNENEPVYKTEIDSATNTLSDYTSATGASHYGAGKKQILEQRVKDFLNIYVEAADIAGSGGNVTVSTDTTSESDVALVQVRACLYIDKEGNPVTTSSQAFAANTSVSSDYYIETRDIGYAPGLKDSDCRIQSTFENVFPNRAGGTLFTYDLRSLPDGLIKIDIWGVDMVGNSGETESYVQQNYNNNYRSIFVVKDSTAPDAATEVSKVVTQSGRDTNNNVAAPYEWYNAASLNKIQVKDQTGSANLIIHDASAEALRSKDIKLKWIFKVGNDPNWSPSPSDTAWEPIHEIPQNETTMQPKVKTLSNAVSSSDGPVAVTMCLKDDLDNVSAPVLLSSINYDNTAPVLSTPGWVKKTSTTSDVYEDLVATTSTANLTTSGHILKIPFTEEWAGLRRMQLTVQKDGTGQAITQTGFTVRFVPDSGDARNLSFNSTASTSDYKVFSVDDTNPVKSGTLYISGIQIGNDNGGTYRVTVDLWDSSLNHSDTYADISIDKTDPELTRVYIPGLKKSVEGNGSGVNTVSYDGWFLPREYIRTGESSDTPVAPGNIPLYLFVKEADSGIHKISFADDSVALFNTDSKKTTLYKIDNFGQANETSTLIPASLYRIDTTNKTITLDNNISGQYKLSSADEFVLLVKDIGFKEVKYEENTINVTVTDLATRSANKDRISPFTSDNNSTTTYDDTTITGVKADSSLSAATSGDNRKPEYTLKDRGTGAYNGGTGLSATAGYTNDTKINIENIFVGADSGNDSAKSGYNSFKLSGAKFIPGETDVVIPGITDDYHVPYQLSQNNTVITFRHKANAQATDFAPDDAYIVLRNLTFSIKNIQLDDATNGTQTVSITAYDLAGWDHQATDATIILDTTAPVLEKGPFTATYTNSSTSYDSAKTIYPHADGENATGVEVLGTKTFYTAKKISTDTNADYAAVLGIRAKDNISLSGTTNGTTTFLKYLKGIHDKDDILSTGLTAESKVISALTPSNNDEKESLFNFGLETGTYSVVIVDKAGNTSNMFRFKVQAETYGPALTDSNENNPKSLNEYVYIESPESTPSVYKNEIDAFSPYTEFEYRFDYNDNAAADIRTKKYVTKKANGKYKLILNLAADKYTTTNQITRLVNGQEPDTGAAYGELTATAFTAPIEEYAVTTKYSLYPKPNYHNYSYNPQLNNASSWHPFVNRTGTETNTDSYNGIVSYVEGNNLIIELPQQSTAPVSVFLKDACGNQSKMVLGLQSDGTTDNYSIAPSYILDDHLGVAQTDSNGEVITPVVMQNPYMTSGASSNYFDQWDKDQNDVFIKYAWHNQSGNTDGTVGPNNKYTDFGESGYLGYFRDWVKKATYYNTGIDSSVNIKLGLTLRFGAEHGSRTNPESAVFASSQKAPAADVADDKYTARALLYCTQSTTKPTKQTILNCYNSEFGTNGVAGVATGRITDWTYVQAGTSNTVTEVTMLLDYPRPDYSKLTDWTLKNSNNEPEPYYIWYLYEDRAGNYEIAKVVNSPALGDELKTPTDGMFDRWFYDAEKPKITIRGETTSPKDIESYSADVVSSLAGVNKLIATNNGYVPYLKQANTSGTVYVSVSADHTIRATNLKNENVGNGTTHHVENATEGTTVGSQNRQYLPFFDIEVSEATGIRAFCWSNNSTVPTIDNSNVLSDGNTQGDYSNSGRWYAGYTATTLNADIGCDFHYDGGSTRDATNAYFSYDDSSYAGAYSGTKVNTVIPFNLISSGSYIFLHVMDWTGNVQTVRMGKNLVYAKDATNPTITTGSYTDSEPNKYYIKKEADQPPVLRIAGNGTYAAGQQDIEVDLPGISDGTGGTGILGYSLGDNPVYNYSSTDIKEKLTIPYSVYSLYKTSTGTLTYYVYDKVGNISQGTLKCVFDDTAPSIESVALQRYDGYFIDLENGLVTSADERVYTQPASSIYYENAASIPDSILQKIYINKENDVKFKVNLSTATDDIYDIDVRWWTGSQWQHLTSIENNSSYTWTMSGTDKEHSTSFTMGAYTTLYYPREGRIYQILATDISGNTSCQYFKLYLDNVAPTFEVEPTVTIGKGSINKDAADNVYYYTTGSSDNEKMSVTFTLKDENGIGGETLGTNNKLYYRIGTSGSWMTLKDTSDNPTRSITLYYSSGNVESIYVMDELGNISSATPLKYVYGEGANDYKQISNLQYYNAAVPTTTTYTAQAGWPGNYQTNTCNILDNGVLVLASYYSHSKIQFTKPAGIIGYVAETPSTTAGAYSMKSLSTEFEVQLNSDKTDLTKTFYAVDYVGNYRPITVVFTYKNPLAAQDIVFLPAADVPTDVATSLGVTLTPTVDNGTTRYYKNDWIVVRCTLKKNDAGTAYSATPTTVKLYNTNSITNSTSALSTHTGTSLKTCSTTTSPEGVTDRYYYYLAFELSDSHKDQTLYCVMTDASKNTSDATALGSGVTWKHDTEKPGVAEPWCKEDEHGPKNGTKFKVKKLWKYSLATNTDTPTVEDSYIGYWQGGYKSISYVTGTKVYFPVAAFTDNAKVAEYKIVTTLQTSGEENKTSLGYTATDNASTNATNHNYDSGWQALTLDTAETNYEITLPDVTQPHRHIVIYLRDIYGNVSEPYYLGHKDHQDYQWWILDKTVAKTDVTSTSRDGNTNKFNISIPAGTIIKTLEVTGGATISGVSINGYPDDSSKQPGYNTSTYELTSVNNAATGWIIVEDAKNTTPTFTPGFKVTLDNIPGASWDGDIVIKIKINGVEIDTDGKQLLTISKKNFSKDNIQLQTGHYDGNNYVIPVQLTDGAPASKITAVAAISETVTAEWDADNKTITLKNLPDPSWNTEQKISIKINDNDNFTFADVLTIGKLTLGIESGSLNPATLDDTTTSVSFKLSKSENLTINSVSADATLGTIAGPDENGVYTLTAVTDGKIPQTAAISIVTSYGTVTNHSVKLALSTGTLTHNNIRGTGFTAGGITAFGGGAGSGETAGSRITQFFNNVANVFVADSTAEKPVAQNKQAEKEAKALAKAAKKATKKAKKSKKSQAATSPVVELTQSDSINTTVTTDTMMPVIEWEQSDRIEITEVTEEAQAMSLSATSSQSAQDSDVQIIGSSPMMTEESETTQHSSTSAILVVMLAVLSSAGGAWYILKARKRK